MRLLALCALAVLFAGSIALAQEGPIDQFAPRFEPGADIRGIYPQRALERGQGGIAHLCCRARNDRSLACETALVEPRNRGFEEAAANYVRDLRLTEESYEALRLQQQPVFQLALRWHVAPPARRLGRRAASMQQRPGDLHQPAEGERAPNLCGPDGGAASDYVVVSASRLR